MPTEPSSNATATDALTGSTERWLDMVPGVRRRTLVHGETMMQMMVGFAVGSHLPEHQHPHEQITHVLSGRLRLTTPNGVHDLEAGQSFYLAPNVPHSADALADSLALDTFSPPREDLLAQDARG